MRRLGCALLIAGLLAIVPAGTAQAEFGIVPGSTTFEVLDAAGDPELRAGAHPDKVRFGFELNTTATGGVDGNIRNLSVELPVGLAGDPSAVPSCPREVFEAGFLVGGGGCPAVSAVGSATVKMVGLAEGSASLFSVVPGHGQLGAVGLNPLMKFQIGLRLRPTDYGVTLSMSDFPQPLAVSKMLIELWGVPADHQQGALPRRAAVSLPTRCDGTPLTLTVRAQSWQQPHLWHGAQAQAGVLSACGELPFAPELRLGLSTAIADSPAGTEVRVTVPQSEDPDGLASSQLRAVRLTMPAGMSVSPPGVVGLGACADAQIGVGTEAPARCPQSSRVGGFELTGPALLTPLQGAVFAGRELPGDRFRLFLVARGEGVEAKLAGSLRVDPQSGRISVRLPELPQIAFEDIVLRFDAGPRALLSTPPGCGTMTAEAIFEPHSGGPPASSSSPVTIDGHPTLPHCGPRPFAPSFEAGSTRARAGRSTGFSFVLRRSDGEQSPSRLGVSFPPGLSASLSSVEPCESAAAACPAAARIGSATAELGPGPAPVALRGDAFLTGPHLDAPFGLMLAFPASLGPYDFGRLLVRAGLRMDPRSGRLEIETDPLPAFLEGIPLRFRSIALEIDRPGFLRNPTSCEEAEVNGRVTSSAGALWQPASPFFLRGCERLGFRPRASLALGDPAELHRGGKPELKISVRTRPRDANLRSARFQLPSLLGYDASGLRALCSRRAAGNDNCPAGAAVGGAVARTPLLDGPLRGRVYAVQPHGDGLPDLWAAIRGSGVRLDVRSKTKLVGSRLQTKLVGLPDLPISSFSMRLAGGERGILSLAAEPCARTARSGASAVAFEGQNRAFRIGSTPLSRKACAASDVG